MAVCKSLFHLLLIRRKREWMRHDRDRREERNRVQRVWRRERGREFAHDLYI